MISISEAISSCLRNLKVKNRLLISNSYSSVSSSVSTPTLSQFGGVHGNQKGTSKMVYNRM